MKRRLLIFGILTLLVAGAVIVWHYRARLFPDDKGSEIFQRYEHHPGIEADYIKDFRINDTITANVTLFVAKDSVNYVLLLHDFELSDDYIKAIFLFSQQLTDEENRFSGKYKNSIIAVFPLRRSVVLFDTDNEQDKKLILRGNLFETIKIKKHEENN